MMTSEELQTELDRINRRLRQVLSLLVNAPRDCTTIPDEQGAYQGNDWFIGTDLIGEADELMAQWDHEDGAESASPSEPRP